MGILLSVPKLRIETVLKYTHLPLGFRSLEVYSVPNSNVFISMNILPPYRTYFGVCGFFMDYRWLYKISLHDPWYTQLARRSSSASQHSYWIHDGPQSCGTDKKWINPCQKPAYVAEFILRRLTHQVDNVVVVGQGERFPPEGQTKTEVHQSMVPTRSRNIPRPHT